MNQLSVRALLIAAAVAVSVPVTAQEQEQIELSESSPVRRIRTIGEDEGKYYQVDCKNGKKGSIEVYSNPSQVCASPLFGEQKCLVAWKLEDAAAHNCK